MKLSLKFTHYLIASSSLFIMETTFADPKTCPVLNQTELKQLCRWTGLSKIPGLKIKAGQVTIGETTLENKLGSCGESDSVKAFLSNDPSKTYEGVLTKNPTDPNNSSKALCTYKISTLSGKERSIGFEVTFPSEISKIQPKTGPKKIQGVDITTSPDTQSVEIKKEKLIQNPSPTSKPPIHSQTVPTDRPVPPAAMIQAQQPPLGAPPAFPGTNTGSKPPSRKPPAPPTQSAGEGTSSNLSPSNSAARGMMFHDEEFTNKMKERKLRNAEGN